MSCVDVYKRERNLSGPECFAGKVRHDNTVLTSREENIRRIAHVSALMKDAGIVVLSAFVSPYQKDRDFVRACSNGNFSELFISTPLEVCEQRDVKGLYAKARAGEISDFTGISAPFEAPGNPELDVPTHTMSIEEAAAMVVAYIIPKITGDNE